MNNNNNNDTGIRIGHTNVYHLYNKQADICRLLNQPPYIHILGISETRLNSQKPNVPQYSFLRRDADGAPLHTGMGIFVHNSIKQHVKRRKDLEPDQIECMWVEFKSISQPCLVGFIYRNPDSPHAWYNDFVNMLDKVSNEDKSILLMGDMNINLLLPHSDWENTYSLFGLCQLVTQATRITETSSTLIDHIYTNNPQMTSNIRVLNNSFSDHFPIICTWSCKIPPRKNKGHTAIQFRSLKHFNETDFLFDLSNANFSCVFTCNDADDALSLWYNTFLPIVDKHAPLRTKRVKHATLPRWLSPEIIQAMEVRDQFKAEKKVDEYRKQRNRVTYLVRQAKKSLFSDLIAKSKDTGPIWRAMNEITHKSRNQSNPFFTHSPDSFNDHFLSVTDSIKQPAQNSLDVDNKTEYDAQTLLRNFCHNKLKATNSAEIPEIAVHEVGAIISKMKNKKSMGLDNITSTLLKLSLPYTVESLTYVYNLCIKQSKFPTALKIAKVIPIPKSKDSSSPNNCRPISLLSVISKPLEKHIQKNLLEFVETHELFHPFQSGFRKYHSCTTAITRLCDTWLSAINKTKLVGAVFLDIKKAFDCVDHTLLLSKLEQYFQNDKTTAILKSYLEDRVQRVFLNGKYSKVGAVRSGVPQGSVLGPLLFGLYINDLPLNIKDKTVVCDLFADDSTLHTNSSNLNTINSSLQNSVHDVNNWCRHNKMVLHTGKTKCMVITTRQKHQIQPLPLKLTLQAVPIEQVNQHEILGVIIDNEFKWQAHINALTKKMSTNLFLLKQLTHYVDSDARKMFFQAHCLSRINYASPVWCGAAQVHIRKLNSHHRRAAKLILPDPSQTTQQKMNTLDILPMHKQFEFNKTILVFKIQNKEAPKYLNQLLTKASERYESTRLIPPLPKINLYLTSFAFSGSSIWNALPIHLHNIHSIRAFKLSLKEHMIST